jgi:hypothetical protein
MEENAPQNPPASVGLEMSEPDPKGATWGDLTPLHGGGWFFERVGRKYLLGEELALGVYCVEVWASGRFAVGCIALELPWARGELARQLAGADADLLELVREDLSLLSMALRLQMVDEWLTQDLQDPDDEEHELLNRFLRGGGEAKDLLITALDRQGRRRVARFATRLGARVFARVTE